VAADRARANVARTAHMTATARALGRFTAGGDAANGDHLAERCLIASGRMLVAIPRLGRWMFERFIPGALGYFNARTQHFDAILAKEAASHLGQLVLLGAGFDSRPIRLADRLNGVRVFEVDMPEVLAVRAQRLPNAPSASPGRIPVPIDFEHDDLVQTLSAKGYDGKLRTLFLWEGVTYYLPPAAVGSVLSMVATRSGPGSSILFDYVTEAFVKGDHSTYGAGQLAESWRRLGNVNRSGFDDIASLLTAHGLRLQSDLDAGTLDQRYLSSLPGHPLKSWGCMRIAHATIGN